MKNTQFNRHKKRNNESYLSRLFEQDEVLPTVDESSSIRPTPDQLTDEDIEILDDELQLEDTQKISPSPSVEDVSSSSRLEDVLRDIAQWKDDFENSTVLDSFITGAEILENDTERKSFSYLTESQYGAFSKLIEASREIAKLINDLSYDSEKLLGEIELSRKMMISEED
jgi:hypothetical protein